jgi:penicillin-binding protein 1B
MLTPAAMVSEVRASDGRVLYQNSPHSRSALDPRVNYLMVNMLQEVLRSGTGAGARAMGFTQPAAGKTGTSRDGWFAGFTTELLCVVWVGFDDNRDLNLEGAKSALPIWAEFMSRASKIAPYSEAKEFNIPRGIRSVRICSESGDLATEFCPDPHADVFIEGSEPAKQCSMHGPDLPVDIESTPLYTVPPPSGRDRDPGGQ